MSFVFPILLAGLGLLVVPILIHLILRQKPKTLKFPAFRFLVKRHRTNLRKLQLRHLLLLLMRMALLALICLALARPKVSSDLLNLQTDRPVAAIFLFDTSYSMQYKTTGDETRLDDAKKRAIQMLKTLHSESRVAVLDTAEGVIAEKGEWLKRDKAISRIDALSLRPDNAAVTTRLESAYQLFYKLALGDEPILRRLPRFLCVFSDGMQSSWDTQQLPQLQQSADGIPPPVERLFLIENKIASKIDLLKQLRQRLPPETEQDYPEQSLIEAWKELRRKIPSAGWHNYPDQDWIKLLGRIRGRTRQLIEQLQSQSVKELPPSKKEFHRQMLDSLHEGMREVQGVYAVFVDVGVKKPIDLGLLYLDFPGGSISGQDQRQIFSQNESFNLQVVVQASGSDFDTSLVCELDRKELQRQDVSLQDGQSRTYFFPIRCENLKPGYHHLQMQISGKDHLAFSNHRFATFVIRPPRKILILTDALERVWLWKLAIERNPKVRFHCTVHSGEYLEKAGPQELAQYHAVYVMNVVDPPESLWSALKTYVDRGGNVAIIPGGKKTNTEAYNKDKTATELLPGELEYVVAADDPGLQWNWEDDSIYQHPFLKPFGHWRLMGRTDFIDNPRRVYQYWKVKPYLDQSLVLVNYKDESQDPAVLERAFGAGKGRVVLLTTRLDVPRKGTSAKEPAWNNYLKFDNNSWVIVFPGELTIYLAGDMEHARLNFLSGTIPKVALPPGSGELQFTLKGPGITRMAPRPEQQNELPLRKAVFPGNYWVESDDEPIGAFSVNIPSEEGVLKRVPLLQIQSLFGRDAVVSPTQGVALKDELQGYWSTPEELLPMLMLGLLILLVLENLLANLFYRREPKPQE